VQHRHGTQGIKRIVTKINVKSRIKEDGTILPLTRALPKKSLMTTIPKKVGYQIKILKYKVVADPEHKGRKDET